MYHLAISNIVIRKFVFMDEWPWNFFCLMNTKKSYLLIDWLISIFLFVFFLDVCMVGDDVRDDVLGAQNVGFAVSTF